MVTAAAAECCGRPSSSTSRGIARHPDRRLDRIAKCICGRIAFASITLATVGGSVEAASVNDEIAEIVGARTPAHRATMEYEHGVRVEQIYSQDDGGAVWFTAAGARPDVAVALRELRAAGTRGLSVSDYNVDRLARDVQAAGSADAPARSVARADVALTAAMLRLLADLRFGRVPPQAVEPDYRVTPKDGSLLSTLREAVASGRLADTIDAAEPSFPQYIRLKQLLARYQALAVQPWLSLPRSRHIARKSCREIRTRAFVRSTTTSSGWAICNPTPRILSTASTRVRSPTQSCNSRVGTVCSRTE